MKVIRKMLPIILLLLAACELIVDVDVPHEKSKLVVGAVQRQDRPWRVDLTRSIYILERPGAFPAVTTGVISVTDDNNNTFTLQHDSLFLYTGNTYPVPGQHYNLTIEAPGYDPVDAGFTMPQIVKIVDLFIDSAGIENAGYDYYVAQVPVDITFNDPGGVSNYYTATFAYYFQHEIRNNMGQVIGIDTAIATHPILFEQGGFSDIDELSLYFGDRTFDGQKTTLRGKLRFNSLPRSVYRLEISLGNISEEHYRYLKDVELQGRSGDDPFAQPVQVHSNINNGFGTFGGITYDVISWEP
jgi:hypothetical protein